ncbi:MAG: DUF4381 family protein [Pseudomonadota bacterium]
MIELADIIAPIAPPPAPPPYAWIALGVTLVILVLYFVLHRWLKRTRNQRLARAALKRTERELQLGTLDARAATFQIARAVQCVSPPISLPFKGRVGVGMGAKAMRVNPIPLLTSLLKGEEEYSLSTEAWSKFMQELDRARFSPDPIDIPQAVQLLSEARRWVSQAI